LRKLVLDNGRADFSLHNYFTDEKGNLYTVYVKRPVKPNEAEVAEQLNKASWASKPFMKEESFKYGDGRPMLDEEARQRNFGRAYQVGLGWREGSRKDFIPWYGGMNAREVAACELPCVYLGVMENGKIGPVKRPEKPVAEPVTPHQTGEEYDGFGFFSEQPPPGTGPPH